MRYIPAERRLIWSASDLKAAAECEFAWLRAIDAKLGRIEAVDEPDDPTLERAGRLGDEHERRVLERYRAQYGRGVVEIPQASSADERALASAVERTREVLVSDAAVLFQAAFRTDEFVGFADFLVRDDDGRWRVQDSKLARTARTTALMQLAAYVDQLDRLGVPRSAEVDLLHGDGTVSTHRVDDLLPFFEVRRARLRALIADRDLDAGASGAPIGWDDPRGDLDVVACGRCATCEQEVIAHRDLLLVAGMRPVQRTRLQDAGIRTIDELAAAVRPPARMNADVFDGLRVQARLQLDSPAGVPDAGPVAAGSGAREAEHGRDAGAVGGVADAGADGGGADAERGRAAARADGAGARMDGGDAPAPVPAYEVVMPAALSGMPRPDRGDIFFDFEGDPLYTEGAGDRWGIDYLFGWVDLGGNYTALWAHSFAEERAALESFCDFVAARRAAHPGMHIYHYAPYEPTHLVAMAARHGVREADVDRMLRDELFVDLYPIVRRALRVGSRSYSIKKLEPLYMGDEVRSSDVQKGDDSIVRYVEARALQRGGEGARAREILDDLADYNRYDCISTLRLRDWLVERAREANMLPAPPDSEEAAAYEPSPRALALTAWADALHAEREPAPDGGSPQAGAPSVAVDGGSSRVASSTPRATADVELPDDEAALRLGAAAIDYYPREAKTFWSAHFQRLREPVSLWAETRDVVVLDPARCRVVDDWHVPDDRRAQVRVLQLSGDVAPGTRLSAGTEPFLLYAAPAPFPSEASPRWIHVPHWAKVVETHEDGALVEEYAVRGETWNELPLAIAPAAPPRAGNQQQAIDAWADSVLGAAPEADGPASSPDAAVNAARSGRFPADPATDILRRLPPRTRSGGLQPRDGDDIDAIVRTVIDLDHSYLPVQGPPGTGKTYVGAHVIARLVRENGFRVGVVAQSHAVVENLLERVVAAGVPGERVAKAPRSRAGEPERDPCFTVIAKNGVAGFAAEHPDGYVVGGTAWDFSHSGRIPRHSLDLLVIDEAGQFSLASTIAVSLAATRLLLLGDPQQLPQVSQGTHPAPVDVSALGWVMAGAPVLAPDRGYFLARSWRMHPAVARAVSALSYAGQLASRRAPADREITGIEPGLRPVPVRHRGNATESREEAAEVVRIVRDLVGRDFTDIEIGEGGSHVRCPPRPLTAADVLVVAPYNAQQQLVQQALAEAGFAGVRVGTVDRFQGQEAAVSIVTLAASSGRDAPRGADFLLLQNRLNVAISRAEVAAYLIHSPALLDDLPRTPDGVARMSAFARLVGAVPAAEPARETEHARAG